MRVLAGESSTARAVFWLSRARFAQNYGRIGILYGNTERKTKEIEQNLLVFPRLLPIQQGSISSSLLDD
jgi:hypothetical protein